MQMVITKAPGQYPWVSFCSLLLLARFSISLERFVASCTCLKENKNKVNLRFQVITWDSFESSNSQQQLQHCCRLAQWLRVQTECVALIGPHAAGLPQAMLYNVGLWSLVGSLHLHPCKSQPETLFIGAAVMMPVTTSSFKRLKCSQAHCFPSHRGDTAATFPSGMTHNRTPLAGNSLLPTVGTYSLAWKQGAPVLTKVNICCYSI